MKNLKLILSLLSITLFYTACIQPDKNLKTSSFKVYGNCEMCKKRIDKAAKITGVKKADWDADDKIMKVTFDSTVTKVDKIEKAIAGIGHDTQTAKATDAAYSDLPECCQYERSK